MRKNKGVTLISLTITVIVLLILASVGISSGISSIRESKFIKLRNNMEIMQAQVDMLREKYKDVIENEELTAEQKLERLPGKSITEVEVDEYTQQTFLTPDGNKYKYYDKDIQESLGIMDLERNFLVNLEDRMIVTVPGFKYNGQMYYTIEDIKGEIVNVGGLSRGDISFTAKWDIIENERYEITLENIQCSDYVEYYDVKIKDNEDETNTEYKTIATRVKGKNYSFEITDGSRYTIQITDEAGKTGEVDIDLLQFVTEWTVPANTTITLPIYGQAPDVMIDWGDGSEVEHITTTSPTHTYTNAGVYDIKISGNLPRWDFNSINTSKDYITGIKQWGVVGFEDLTRAFYKCTNLTGVIPKPHKKSFENVTNFETTFSGCSGLTGNIPNGLFDNCPQVTSIEGIFLNCSGLTGNIPNGIFDNCPKVTSFCSTFDRCSGLTGNIPNGLFDNCPQATNFDSTFSGCRGLTGSIPNGLFDNCPKVTKFLQTFASCSGLTGSIPEDLFDNCPLVTDFGGTFLGCSGLTGSIPNGLFDNCPKVTNFFQTFASCGGLTGNILEDLFDNCPLVTDFGSTFSRCTNLTGNAPALWDTTKWPNVTDSEFCFFGCSNLSNYADIPTGWK